MLNIKITMNYRTFEAMKIKYKTKTFIKNSECYNIETKFKKNVEKSIQLSSSSYSKV